VDFENAIEQNEVLNAVLDSLMENDGVPPDEIMIDITGGQKVCSVAGTIVSLSKDWSIQYVSTSDYTIKEYIFTMEASDVGS
jgi:beta-glucanase (GH16 family)